MGLLSSVGSLKKDEDFKLEEKNRRIQRILDERAKSANERALESFAEEERQDFMKKKLAEINEERGRKMFFGKLAKSKNIFKNHQNILRSDMNMLKSKNIFKGKSLFFK